MTTTTAPRPGKQPRPRREEHGNAVPVTVAHGDGIGPEIMDAVLRILDAGGARLAVEGIEIGEAVYRRGRSAGIQASAWESLRRPRVFLKAPITTPQGGGSSRSTSLCASPSVCTRTCGRAWPTHPSSPPGTPGWTW